MFSLFANPYCAPVAAPEPSFTTLFRLLDDFDSYNREVQQAPQQQQQQQPQQPQPQSKPKKTHQPRRQIRRTVTTTFKPPVDVRETAGAYELHVELPGIQKENLNIEFTDPQTLIVRGRVERTYESKPDEEEETTAVTEPEVAPAAAEEKTTDADETASNASSHGWHHATVEDDPEEPGTPAGASTPVETPVATPKTEVAKPATPTVTAVQKAPETPKEKVWLYERSIGQFSRSFTFPTRVDHENVSASLENGVLSITVPKAPKHQVRRIAIF